MTWLHFDWLALVLRQKCFTYCILLCKSYRCTHIINSIASLSFFCLAIDYIGHDLFDLGQFFLIINFWRNTLNFRFYFIFFLHSSIFHILLFFNIFDDLFLILSTIFSQGWLCFDVLLLNFLYKFFQNFIFLLLGNGFTLLFLRLCLLIRLYFLFRLDHLLWCCCLSWCSRFSLEKRLAIIDVTFT